MATNPFRMVYDEFWRRIEANGTLAEAFAVGNRVKYDVPNPIKDSRGTSDFPEMRLVVSGGMPHPDHTSTTSSCTLRLSVQVNTGMQDKERLLSLFWGLFCAMIGWERSLRELLWNGEQFAQQFSIVDMTTEMFQPVPELGLMGTRGWLMVWTVEIGCFFTSTKVQQGE